MAARIALKTMAARIAACLALAATAAALDRVEVSIETRIAAPRVDASALAAGSLEAALEELARVQRFRDDLVSGDAATPLGGYTVEVVAKSSEYEARAGDDRDEDDDADATVGSADVELTERQLRALPFRAARQVKRSRQPLKAWLKLASDFPAFRGSLAGPMPRNVSADLEAWAPPRLERLWVAGVDVPVRAEGAHGLVRDALRAVEDHAARVAELEALGVAFDDLRAARPAPTAVGGLGALDDARHSSVVYDSGADEDADFADDDAAVDARLFFDPSSKRELEVALRVLDVYMDVDMKQTSVPVVVRVHPSDARCRAALAALPGGPARRRFLAELWKAPRAAGGLDGGAVRKAFRAALDAKARGRADALFDAAEAAGDVFGAAAAGLGLDALGAPAVVANGRVTFLTDDEGLMDHEQARRAVGAAVERAHARGAPDGGAPFFSRTLTPLAVDGPDEPRELLFSKVAKGAAPPPPGWTVYVGGDDDDAGPAWAAYLRAIDASTRVDDGFREAPAKKHKKKARRRGPDLKPPFLVCNDVVTPLALPTPPASADPAAVRALARCARSLKAVDRRPRWEADVDRAPAALKHASTRGDARFEVLALVDPLGPAAAVVARLLVTLSDWGNVTVAFAPQEGSDLRKWSQTSMWGEPVVFDAIVTAGRVRVEPKTPSWWRLRLVEAAGGDVDNLAPAEVAGAVTARYAVDAVYVRGQARNTIRGAIGASFADRLEAARCVAVNGGASQVVEANGEFTVAVSDFNATLTLGSANRPVPSRSLAPKPLKHRRDYFSACNRSTSRDGTVHVFSVASGQTYERLLRIMMGSAALATSRPLKFWLLAEFLSPAFDAPALAAALGVDIELLDSPPWPEFLTDDLDRSKVGIRGDKQRLIWAYKLLFLDALFLGRTDRVIFVDADQVVLGDLAELFDMDLRENPYAFTPFCKGGDANPTTRGHRFWDGGFWKTHLGEWYDYHISALFVVDVPAFARYGDSIRGAYKGMAPNPDSLANLDQDLPNYLQTNGVPILALPQEWLYCETWCHPRTKPAAKSIDMCQNPLTKEHKLDMARRIADPLWSALDSYFARLAAGEPEDLMSLRSAAFGLSVTPDAAPVGDGEL